jgi:hypothetical protein
MIADRGGSLKTGSALRVASLILIVFSLVVGVVTRPLSIIHYIDFRYDQAIDAGRVMGMWHGIVPQFGPQPLHQPFGLPPLYYYLVFPSSVFGPNPIFQVLPNAILSLCSIAALMYLIYTLLDSVVPAKRLLLTAIIGLWWSVSNVDIQLANREWNPSFVPFFLICFAILYALMAKRKLTVFASALVSIAYGGAAAILVSLHGSTLLVTPIVFVTSLVYFVVVHRNNSKAWLYPALAVAALLLCLTPYVQSELAHHFDNTRAIVAAVSSHTNSALSTRIDNARSAYLGLRGTMYFPPFAFRSLVLSNDAINQALRVIGALFLIVVPFVGVGYFKGNRLVLGSLALYWLLFLIAASNYPTPYIHYLLPIILAPMILAIVSLAYVDYSTVLGKLATLFIASCIVLSIVINGTDDVAYVQAKFGSYRLMTTTDAIDALARLPSGATICGPEREARIHALGYIDTFITKRNLRFGYQCHVGDYMVRSRYVFEKTRPLAPDINDDLTTVAQAPNANENYVAETEVYTIGRLK